MNKAMNKVNERKMKDKYITKKDLLRLEAHEIAGTEPVTDIWLMISMYSGFSTKKIKTRNIRKAFRKLWGMTTKILQDASDVSDYEYMKHILEYDLISRFRNLSNYNEDEQAALTILDSYVLHEFCRLNEIDFNDALNLMDENENV
jgi:hypothetical protein